MTQLGTGSEGIQKSLDGIFTALTTLMKGKLLRMPALTNLFQIQCNFIERFIPTDSLPLALAAFADPP